MRVLVLLAVSALLLAGPSLPGAMGQGFPSVAELELVTSGDQKEAAGDWLGAEADYTKLIEREPDNPSGYFSRGAVRQRRGDLAGAVKDYTKVLELDPESEGTFNNRGTIRRQTGDLKGALADFERAVELNPENPTFVRNRGGVREELGHLEGGLADLAKTIELEPENAGNYRTRGFILAKHERWLKAYASFDSAAQMQTEDFYPAIYRCFMQMRVGQEREGKRELAEALAQRRAEVQGDWTGKVAEFLLGKIDETALVATAESADSETVQGQMCEAWCYAGFVRLTNGEQAEAARCFRECLATEVKTFVEYGYARAELARLEGKK